MTMGEPGVQGMTQVADFLAESDALAAILQDMAAGDWARATQFKGWTINDVLVHLLFWNRAADMSLFDPDGFGALMARVLPQFQGQGLRSVENSEIPERGADLFALWQAGYRDMAARWADVDPKTRVQWVGPEMSARSSITARQMETWAHGHEVFDLLGRTRAEDDRIRNIVVLGVNTFGFAHRLNGLEIPPDMPRLRLTAPSGAVWDFGEGADLIEGSALAFAQTVTQTRHVRDTDLVVTGPVAERWMAIAQCFAGGAETPPLPGTRFIAGTG